MWWILMSPVLAGTVFVGENGYIDTFDTRSFDVVRLGDAFPYYHHGMAHDETRNRLIISGIKLFQPMMYEVNPDTMDVWDIGYPVDLGITGMGRDPTTGTILGIGSTSNPGVYLSPRSTWFAPLTWGGLSADWYVPGNFLVTTDLTVGLLHAIDVQGTDTVLGPWPWSYSSGYFSGIAYDDDTKTTWFFETTARSLPTVGLDIESLRVVALGPRIAGIGAAGWIDDVPDQTPHLYVTGTCPGTMYITVVDATPGGQVLFGTSNRLRTTQVPSGPCAGTPIALRSPTPQVTLTAGPTGIASQEIQAPAGMCGRTLIQAIDLDTCLTTAVETVRNTWSPP